MFATDFVGLGPDEFSDYSSPVSGTCSPPVTRCINALLGRTLACNRAVEYCAGVCAFAVLLMGPYLGRPYLFQMQSLEWK